MSKRFQRDKDRKIADIQSAFTELINTTGYDKVTVRQIAKKAGISVGIIYHYYPKGKPSVAAAIYEENFLDTIRPYALETDRKELEKKFRDHLKNHRENIELFRAFDQAILTDQDVFASVKTDRKRLLKEYATENNYPIEKVDAWLVAYNVIDAIIHRHLYIEKICKSDEELVQLISSIYSSILSIIKPGI
jgi:AcrR family transcriptional regulator